MSLSRCSPRRHRDSTRKYSPHAWGWTCPHVMTAIGRLRIPHTRGGGPTFKPFKVLILLYSPHAWGWTYHRPDRPMSPASIPHTRGGGPKSLKTSPPPPRYSPHAWGWTTQSSCVLASFGVFPTRVGVDRTHRKHHPRLGNMGVDLHRRP